jgi:DNA-binding GntR family transcriptional regulator
MKKDIYQIIRNRILYLEYKPGQILNEKVLAKEFNISSSPIKDVVNHLEWEQLVRVIPRTGSMITEIEFSNVMNTYQVRFEIEEFEGRLAGANFSAENIVKLKTIHENCIKLSDTKNSKALAEIDLCIRALIHSAAGNPVLAKVSDRLYTQTFRLWCTVLEKNEWAEEVAALIQELEILLTCVSSGDSKQLGEIRRIQLSNHFERLRNKFLGV